MSLSIFSFDLAALIHSLSNLGNLPEEEITEIMQSPEVSLNSTTEVLAATAEISDSIIDDILLATAISNAAVSLNSSDEIPKKEIAEPKKTTSVPPVPIANSSDEEYKKAIEELIKSLQTSVIHSFQGSDIINETVSLKTAADVLKKRPSTDRRDESEKAAEERKKQELKFRQLKEDLKNREFTYKV